MNQANGPGSRDYRPGGSVPWRVREMGRASNDKGKTPALERNNSPIGPTGLGEGSGRSRAADAKVATGRRGISSGRRGQTLACPEDPSHGARVGLGAKEAWPDTQHSAGCSLGPGLLP